MIESEEILDAKSLIVSLEETKGAWLELQNHIKSFHNLQECIDHFNNLEGIESEPQTFKLGDVLLQNRTDFEFVLTDELTPEEADLYVQKLQELLVIFESQSSEVYAE